MRLQGEAFALAKPKLVTDELVLGDAVAGERLAEDQKRLATEQAIREKKLQSEREARAATRNGL